MDKSVSGKHLLYLTAFSPWFTEVFVSVPGVHILQEMLGCDWDDNIKNSTGYYRTGYDGEDFASFDLKTLTWVYTEKAATVKNKWESPAENQQSQNVLKNICPEWLKKYLEYGTSFLKRKGRIT